ncbi:hypothetical protein VNO78_12001 [Psophocarpus tetragonolobus]|uniref:Uncharacterized protein n=1 Tax=Psophocarpus tetragonolobus TaxID=3891 RepID=A0AAN9XP62_PSOTE
MAPLSIGELHQFHRTHREVFCFLIFKLHRDLTQSLLVMALWIWLEHNGYPNISHRVMSLPLTSIDALVNEALSCLKCLKVHNFVIPKDGGLPSTTKLTHRDISLRIFNEKRYTIVTGIKSVLKNICARIFADVLHIVLKSNHIKKVGTLRGNRSHMPLTIPGFPHPLFGTFDVPPKNTMNLDLFDVRIWTNSPFDDVTIDDKTMFLTFSRGFPVSEDEAKQLFTSRYGDCVESLSMGKIDMHNQSMFAKMVLKTVTTVDHILNGKRVAKLQINGKHIWARKYDRRD